MQRTYTYICTLACLIAAAPAGSPAQARDAAVPECERTTGNEIRSEIEAEMGMPVSHKDHQDPPDTAVMCYDRFCTELNASTKQPNWVVERLTPEIVTGKFKRPHTKFKPDGEKPDGKRPKGMPTASDVDYAKSGYARGHQAASADFKCSPNWMKQTFVFSNAVPQVQDGFNGGIWRQLEDHVQKLAKRREEIFVITGPVDLNKKGKKTIVSKAQNSCGNRIELTGLKKLEKSSICNANDEDPSKSCDAGVAVPAGLFKIIYIPETGRAFGFLMSNEDHRKFKKRGVSAAAYFEEWRASIAAIEQVTNVKFFTDLSLRASRVRKEQCAATRWR